MRKLILIVISAFALLGSPAFAKDPASAGWIVSQLSGDARVVRPGLQPVALKTAARLGPGDRIVTGLTGRATLTRGADYIIVAPHSDLQLPATAQPKGFTRVIQNLGTMLFKVKHTGIPHFAVDTPMLAAVVKGTTFTVVVGPDRSAVQVIEGRVEVTATDGGMSRLVEGGKTVFIDRNEPKRLIDADERSPAATSSSSTTAVRVTGSGTPSVATIANLTGGLIQPATQASAPAPTPVVPDVAAATTASNGGQPAVDTGAAAPGVGNTVTDAVDTTTGAVSDVVDTTTGAVTDVVDTTTGTAADVLDTTTGTVTDVVDTTTGAVTDVVDTTTGTVVDVVGTVTDVVDTTTGAVTDVVDTTTGAVVEVVDTTTDTATDVVDTVTDVVDVIIPDVIEPVADVVDTVAEVVDTTVPDVTDTVADVVNTTTDVIGGILGGLFPR